MIKVGSTLSVAAAVGTGIGAILAYLYDPNAGNRRRRDIQKRVNQAIEDAVETLGIVGNGAREFGDRVVDDTPLGKFFPVRKRRFDQRVGHAMRGPGILVPLAIAAGAATLIALGLRKMGDQDVMSDEAYGTAYKRGATSPVGS